MMLRALVGLFSMQLLILSFFLSLSLAARSVYAQLIPQALMQKAQSEGEVRVIVRLAVSDTPGTWVNSDILQSLRRADIARAQNSVRAGLLNVRHQVRRQFEDFPFIALQVGADGLRTLELLRGVVEVVEDQLNAPFLAESVPLVQADQVWPGGSAGLALDGGGTVVAVLDTGVDKTHPFLGGKVVEEACFSTNDVNSSATSVCMPRRRRVFICRGIRPAVRCAARLRPRHPRCRYRSRERSGWRRGAVLRRCERRQDHGGPGFHNDK